MTAEQAEANLFEDALCFLEVLPVRFRQQALDETEEDQTAERAESLLRMMAQLEDSNTEDSDDRTSADLHRIEAKLQLTLELIGALVANSTARLPAQKVRWSRRGLSLEQQAACEEGAVGMVELQLVPWLPHLLTLSCRVLACEPDGSASTLWLGFDPLPQALETAIERNLFRRHRRAIAGGRRVQGRR